MKQKPVKVAYRHEYRRQFNDQGKALPPPAETSQVGDKLVMTIDGIRYVGMQDKARGFYWLPEGGEG